MTQRVIKGSGQTRKYASVQKRHRFPSSSRVCRARCGTPRTSSIGAVQHIVVHTIFRTDDTTTMSTDTQVKDKEKTPTIDLADLPNELSARGREIWLAGLGALSRLEEEGDKVFTNLVERGKEYEGKRRKQIDDATENLRKQQESLTSDVSKRIDDATKTVEDAVNRTVNSTLGRIGVPTRHEVRALSEKVGDLSRKLDALSTMLQSQTGESDEMVYHVTPSEDGWAVIREGAERATSVHATKKEAVSAGRETAKSHAPSELIVHKQDRSVQETFSYDEEDVDDA